MKPVIRLPAQLPGQYSLLNINRLLRTDAVRLDWSDVRADLVTPSQLDMLLYGLSLSDHFERIGGSTVSEALSPLISAAFYRAENDADATISRPIRTKSQALPQPTTWTPQTLKAENEGERTIIRKRPAEITQKRPQENESERTIIRKKPAQ